MSLEGMKDDMDKMLDKLRAGELGETPVLVWWNNEAKDEAQIYAQKMDKGDALLLVAAILGMFDLHPLAAFAGPGYNREIERRDGPLYRGKN